jgi:hypothetical protein
MESKKITSDLFKCKCDRSYHIICDHDLLDDYPPDEMNTSITVKEVK